MEVDRMVTQAQAGRWRVPLCRIRNMALAFFSRSLATAALIFTLVWASFLALGAQDASNDQVATRLSLTLSIVERGSFDIDEVADLTADKARFGDHYYSDKPPGQSLLAVPVVFAAEVFSRMFGAPVDSTTRAGFERLAGVATWNVNGLVSALAAAVLYLTALRVGASRQAALFATFAYAMATPVFGWSTAFFAHSLSASFLVFGLGVLSLALPMHPWWRNRPFLHGVLAGLLAGFAVTTDLMIAPFFAAICLTLLMLRGQEGAASVVSLFIGGLVGSALGIAPLLLYNAAVFGHPLTVGYSNVVGFDGMKQGFFGISWPRPGVIRELLVGRFRGLLPLSPIIVVGLAGLVLMLREPARRPFGLLGLVACMAYLLLNAGYVYWDGGYSTGPRHLVPAMAFVGLGFAFAWPRSPVVRSAILLLLAASVVISLACATTGMFADVEYGSALYAYIFPGLLTLDSLGSALILFSIYAFFALALAASPNSAWNPGHRSSIAFSSAVGDTPAQ